PNFGGIRFRRCSCRGTMPGSQSGGRRRGRGLRKGGDPDTFRGYPRTSKTSLYPAVNSSPERHMHPFIDTQKEWLRNNVPPFRAGDTLRVNVRVREGDKERLQAFEGVC